MNSGTAPTAQGSTTRCSRLGTTEWTLVPCELNLETLDTGDILEHVAAGSVPREVLALIPLMQRGAEAGIIDRWLEIAGAEADLSRRGDYSLAVVFAEAVGKRAVWQKALEGFNVIESQLVAEWKAEARGLGKIEGRVESLLRVMQRPYGSIPEEVTGSIRASRDLEQLDHWLDAVATAPTLEEFRRQAGL